MYPRPPVIPRSWRSQISMGDPCHLHVAMIGSNDRKSSIPSLRLPMRRITSAHSFLLLLVRRAFFFLFFCGAAAVAAGRGKF